MIKSIEMVGSDWFEYVKSLKNLEILKNVNLILWQRNK